MSYEKMMKWQKTHRKGTKQPVIMHTNRGFTPSLAFLDVYWEYRAECESANIIPAACEDYYRNGKEFNRILIEAQQNS
jgi:hypothetical protein